MLETKETARLEAFSDGVFAIAITLLILEIKVPPADSIHSTGALWQRLFELWPSYFSFIYSFGAILIMWLNHHRAFSIIKKTSLPFMYANGFLLLTVTFIPFPTALLSQYITTDFQKPAIIFFCFSSMLNSFAFVLWSNAFMRPKRLIDPNIDPKTIAKSYKSTRFGFFLYSFTTALAFWLPTTALLINCSAWVLWIALSMQEFSSQKKDRK